MPGRYDRAIDATVGYGPYAGLAVGGGLELYDRAVNGGGSVFDVAFNGWGGDHVVHAGFSWGLTELSDRAVDAGSRYTGAALDRAAGATDRDVGRYLEQAAETARHPSTKRYAVAAGSAVTAFTLLKEGVVHVPVVPPGFQDSAVELGDVAGNYAPMVKYTDVPDMVSRRIRDRYDRGPGDAGERPADD